MLSCSSLVALEKFSLIRPLTCDGIVGCASPFPFIHTSRGSSCSTVVRLDKTGLRRPHFIRQTIAFFFQHHFSFRWEFCLFFRFTHTSSDRFFSSFSKTIVLNVCLQSILHYSPPVLLVYPERDLTSIVQSPLRQYAFPAESSHVVSLSPVCA